MKALALRTTRDQPCTECGRDDCPREWFGTYTRCRAPHGCARMDDAEHGVEGPRVDPRDGRAALYRVGGVWQSLRELAEAHDLADNVLRARLAGGWPLTNALREPVQAKRGREPTRVEWKGELVFLRDLCAQHGARFGRVKWRLEQGFSVEDAVLLPCSQGQPLAPRLQRALRAQPKKSANRRHDSQGNSKK